MSLRALVLAAGLGTRLRPFTETQPKGLARVGGRPMIHYALEWLKSQGVREVLINTHHFAARLEDELSRDSLGLSIRFSREEELLGTGGGVARMWRMGGGGRVVAINADTLIDADLARLEARHEDAGALATLAVVRESVPGVYTTVWMDDGGWIVAIGGERPEGKDIHAVNYTGLCILEPRLLTRIDPDRPSCLVRDGLVPALQEGLQVAAYLHEGLFVGMDNLDRIRRAEEILALFELAPREKR